MDLFRCESIGPASRLLKTHWVMVVMDQYTRRIIGFAVHAGNVDGPALCRMFNDATSRRGWPKCLSSDNDPSFRYYRWKTNLRVLEIEEIKSLPHVPMSHPFIERLIGSIRRELLVPCPISSQHFRAPKTRCSKARCAACQGLRPLPARRALLAALAGTLK